jgi:hypothetical protein
MKIATLLTTAVLTAPIVTAVWTPDPSCTVAAKDEPNCGSSEPIWVGWHLKDHPHDLAILNKAACARHCTKYQDTDDELTDLEFSHFFLPDDWFESPGTYIKSIERAMSGSSEETEDEIELGIEEASRMLDGAFKKLVCMRLCQG